MTFKWKVLFWEIYQTLTTSLQMTAAAAGNINKKPAWCSCWCRVCSSGLGSGIWRGHQKCFGGGNEQLCAQRDSVSEGQTITGESGGVWVTDTLTGKQWLSVTPSPEWSIVSATDGIALAANELQVLFSPSPWNFPVVHFWNFYSFLVYCVRTIRPIQLNKTALG